MTNLHVEVQGDEITVTEPGTDYAVIYKKWIDQPNLVMTCASFDLTMRAAFEFRARAGIAANDKARKLGWIV
jgi:hypothetical protein